jgi:hypothetical protein
VGHSLFVTQISVLYFAVNLTHTSTVLIITRRNLFEQLSTEGSTTAVDNPTSTFSIGASRSGKGAVEEEEWKIGQCAIFSLIYSDSRHWYSGSTCTIKRDILQESCIVEAKEDKKYFSQATSKY